MKLTEDDWRRIGIILNSDTEDFASLARRAGFSPEQDFRGADLSRVDFGATNLAGFDFTRADLAGANLSRVAGLKPTMLTNVKYDAATRLPPGWGLTLLPTAASTGSKVGLVRPPPADKPDWADDFGQDAFGTWASFSVRIPRSARIGFLRGTADAVTQRLRWIPPGEYLRGSPPDEDGRFDYEGPQRPVTIAQGFWLFDTPCTQALWQAVMGDNTSQFKTPTRPVERVSCEEVETFMTALNDLLPGLNLSLPSEAQWEYACRAGTATATYAGPNTPEVLDTIAWYDENSRGQTQPVAQKRANDRGLYDMLGNVYEWCADHYHDSYDDAPDDGRPWLDIGPDAGAAGRVLRGGSWYNEARRVRSACRFADDPAFRYVGIGFRCARVQVPSEAPAGAEGREEQARSAERRAATTSPERAGKAEAVKPPGRRR